MAFRLLGEHLTPTEVRATRRSVCPRQDPYSAPDHRLSMTGIGPGEPPVWRLCRGPADALGRISRSHGGAC